MTSGCAPGWLVGAETPDWSSPLVVVDSTLRCPEADPAARREATLTTAAPVPDVRDADGTPAVSSAALKAKIDEFRASQVRKNRTLTRVLNEHDRCRTGTPPATS